MNRRESWTSSVWCTPSPPVVDQPDVLEAYLAFDDGALAEVPQALAAYVDHQQHLAV